jgi:hypothetical protein
VKTAVAVVPRDPIKCFGEFINPDTFPAWVPNLRRVRVIAKDAAGRPLEIHFEYGASRTYSLKYDYNDETREVRWQPQANKRDAVAGFARFDADESGGTKITYGLKYEGGPTELSEVDALLAAFATYMQRVR